MNKPDIIDHDINNPIEPRPYDSTWGIESINIEFYQLGNYPNIAAAREHKATYKSEPMDMGYTAIIDGLYAVQAALECVGVERSDLGCEIIVNGYRRFTDIQLDQIDDALNSLINPNRINS